MQHSAGTEVADELRDLDPKLYSIFVMSRFSKTKWMKEDASTTKWLAITNEPQTRVTVTEALRD
jgi:hypothetical protein